MKEILLTQGCVAVVDDADFDAVNMFKWYAQRIKKGFYAVRNIRKSDGSWGRLYLHQFLSPGVELSDHRDGNGLNNQRNNIRPATTIQNGQGFRRKKLGASSQFRGVWWNKRSNKWKSAIGVKGGPKYLGLFLLEKDAALAYDKAAREIFGEFATPNFPVSCRD